MDPHFTATQKENWWSRTGFGDNYGVRLSGWIIPAETGSYQFALAADDNAELYLSTDDTAAKGVVIATEPQWNGARAFGTTARRPGCP
ncbi:MAG: hypothetical protein HY735_34305, partial [Verrucomicrobia bacterium]|nr:hypothetical protein [Verrucomicrobiota bacterium]